MRVRKDVEAKAGEHAAAARRSSRIGGPWSMKGISRRGFLKTLALRRRDGWALELRAGHRADVAPRSHALSRVSTGLAAAHALVDRRPCRHARWRSGDATEPHNLPHRCHQ